MMVHNLLILVEFFILVKTLIVGIENLTYFFRFEFFPLHVLKLLFKPPYVTQANQVNESVADIALINRVHP